MAKILMMSAKIAVPGLLKRKVFWNKGYYVICSVYDVINKILLHDSNYIVDECISEVKNTQIDNTKGLDVVMPMSNLIGYSDNCSELFVMSHMLV